MNIYERLRSVQNNSSNYVAGSDIIRDSADEIDRLRARIAQLEKDRERLLAALVSVNESTFSHIDGRDLLAEFHPRHLIDIRLYEAIKIARQAIDAAREGE